MCVKYCVRRRAISSPIQFKHIRAMPTPRAFPGYVIIDDGVCYHVNVLG